VTEIEVKRESIIRKGEAGTIVLGLPETANPKSLSIDVPQGVTSTSGSQIFLSGGTVTVDIPLFVSKGASDIIPLKFCLSEINQIKKDVVQYSKDFQLKIEK
jgi:hypothetical protein